MGADQNNANQSHTVVSTVFTIVIALCILGVLAGIFVDPNALARPFLCSDFYYRDVEF